MSSPYEISFLKPSEIAKSPGILNGWDEATRHSGNLYALFQSPAWWRYIQLQDTAGSLGVVRRTSGELAGVMPVRFFRHPLSFGVAKRKVTFLQIPAIRILGCEPLIPEDESLCLDLIRSVFTAFPDSDVIYLEGILRSSYFWKVISESSEVHRLASVYIEEDAIPHHLITLQGNFQEYLAKFKRKTRYNFSAEIRRLREQGAGRLELVRIEDERDIGSFVERASAVESNSWQYRVVGPQISTSQDECTRLARLANQGMFRSYLLQCGDLCCAFLKGFQYSGVYYSSWCAFDQRLADLSPGKVLWYLVIQDLFGHNTPKRLNFFWGDAWYKKLFATETLVGTTTVLVPKRRRAVTHMCFRTVSALRQLRGAARRRRAVSTVSEHAP